MISTFPLLPADSLAVSSNRCSPPCKTRGLSPSSSSASSASSSKGGDSSHQFQKKKEKLHSQPSQPIESLCCACARRSFIHGAAAAAATTTLSPIFDSHASSCLGSDSDPMVMLNNIHPPRPDWYEEFYASALSNGMGSYEAEVAGYKSQLLAGLSGKAEKVLEIGIGTGSNLKYYARDTSMIVFGVDPNRKMEKYAQASAEAAGLPLTSFKFIRAVGEALPVSDASVDAVIGTLVLCSVKDIDLTLKEVKRVLKPGGVYHFIEHVAAKDGTTLRVLQSVLNPLQQTISDGCHLTRNTGKHISEAGFSGLDMSMTFLSNALFLNPHLYGTACK